MTDIRDLITVETDKQAAFGWGHVDELQDDSLWLTCPVCGSDDLTTHQMQIEAGEAWQPVTCDNCGSDWLEVYKPAFRSNINISPDGLSGLGITS